MSMYIKIFHFIIQPFIPDNITQLYVLCNRFDTKKSPLCGKQVMNSRLPSSILLALLFRQGEVMVPEGTTVLNDGDTVVAITTAETEREFEKFFPKR